MPDAKLLIILLAILLGAYRVISFRRARRPFLEAIGISMNGSTPEQFLVGAAIGFAAVGSIFLVETAAGISRVTGVSAPGILLRDWPTWIMVPLVEELLFRGALLGGLLVVFPRAPWGAIALSALVFGAAHALNDDATLLAVVGSAAGAVAYGLAFCAAGRIWLSTGLHFAWNFAQGPLFGFPLSGALVKQGSWIHLERAGPGILTGGSYGPEGGLTGLAGRAVVLVLLAAYLWRWQRPRTSPRAPVTPEARRSS